MLYDRSGVCCAYGAFRMESDDRGHASGVPEAPSVGLVAPAALSHRPPRTRRCTRRAILPHSSLLAHPSAIAPSSTQRRRFTLARTLSGRIGASTRPGRRSTIPRRRLDRGRWCHSTRHRPHSRLAAKTDSPTDVRGLHLRIRIPRPPCVLHTGTVTARARSERPQGAILGGEGRGLA